MLLVTTAYYLNMKSNRTPNDPASNRKGGQPYWDKMKPSKPVPALRKQKTTTGSERAPIELKNEKGWDVVANWYDKMVGDAGSDYHKNVIMPALLDRLEPLKGARVCDVCCGQGFVGKLLVQQGAAYVHGVDASPQLIGSAKKRAGADVRLSFEVVNASNPGSWADGSYDLVTCLLAVHDVAEIAGRDARRLADACDTVEHTLGRVARRRRGLHPMLCSVLIIDEEQVGEGSTDVHS
jgi:2-polyprenyl-3-methyl-5-hydroxy-6-metoxy-1,4-benzoquinol methylase